MNIKIDQMGKKIVQMDKKIVQMRIHHIQTSLLYETFKFLEYKKCSKYILRVFRKSSQQTFPLHA